MDKSGKPYMSVGQLIEALSAFDRNMTVMVFDEIANSYLPIDRDAVAIERSINGEVAVIYVSDELDEYP